MRNVKQLLRLVWFCGLSQREAARATQIGRGTVTDYLHRARTAGLESWESVEGLEDWELEERLFARARTSSPSELRRHLPDWSQVHEELVRDKHVTRSLLWEEYRQSHPEGYSYSRYCELYEAWRKRLDVCLRQEHRAGEKLFVDYCGRTVEIVDSNTGEVREAQIFVAVLGASNYTFAEATWSQKLPDWIGSHRRAFDFFGGTTEIIVPDNLKSAVSRACRYEPEINPTYWEMAEHYGTAIMPARARKPRDKAKVEAGVLMVERWILACLRHRTFFSLSELNREIARLLGRLNDKRLRVVGRSRRELFETLDRPALRPLPSTAYEVAEWKKARPGIDYHVELDRHYYSVPYQLVGQELELRATHSTVEVFRRGKRVTAHPRSFTPGKHTTIAEHMPKAHQGYLEWTPKRLVRWAEQTGPRTRELVETILTSRPHPQQGFRSCLGVMHLGKRYGDERLEQAAARALEIQSPCYQSVKSILRNRLDQKAAAEELPVTEDVDHENVRGADYYK